MLSARALAIQPASAQTDLRLSTRLDDTPPPSFTRPAVFGISDALRATTDVDASLKGHAELRRSGRVIKGDALHYGTDTDHADAYGNVRLIRSGDVFHGPEAHLSVDAMEGYMSAPKYRFRLSNGSGSAERADLIDRDRSVIHNGTYTACECTDHPAWYLKASRFDMDNAADSGIARNGVLFFQGVPIFGSPWLSFPLDSARRSGLLPPTFSYGSSNGWDVSLPYYFNIAPNYDLTLTTRALSKRGVMFTPDFRYLSPTYSGELRISYLPDDAVAKASRYSIVFKHDQTFGAGFAGYVSYNRVSDTDFTNDLGSATNYLAGTQTVFQQEAGLTYKSGPWSVLLREQRWQTFDSSPPYNREPEADVSYARYNVSGFDFGAQANATRFTISTADTTQGDRFVFNPYVSYSINRPSFFFKPMLQWHMASYHLSSIGTDAPSGQPRDFTVNVPTASLDTGLVFERNVRLFGTNLIQTLEPRLFYVYTPYRNQSYAPLFDTATADFGLAEIFTTNTFVGGDRVADQDRMTAALTTRLLSPESGAELARFVIAQSYSFRQQRVTLEPNDVPSSADHSDLIAGASLNIGARFSMEQALQFNQERDELERATAGFVWSPAERHVLNLGYRYTRADLAVLDNQPINQVVASTQWPLTGHLSSIARVNFDMRAHRITAGLIGLQYDAQCWSLGFAAQRYIDSSASSTAGTSRTRVLVQLQLKGLSTVDTGLTEQFKANVPGYSSPASKEAVQSTYSNYE
ncbi:LPS-assembly protein LptD [Caballeronia sp. LZ025]|uniref:LPS-assembly protein LptD n=1 Tax=Caballeronia sp. LZ025 TaxID=3038562 RepID=UPI002859989D|nr:LPS-assembly protein LptD [Caballeronia sp. LZ025]MDR5733928.1 LPS-assembly protein LptD [Caballeronia sp. LZ025]